MNIFHVISCVFLGHIVERLSESSVPGWTRIRCARCGRLGLSFRELLVW